MNTEQQQSHLTAPVPSEGAKTAPPTAIDLKKLAAHLQHMWDGAEEGDMARVAYHGGNIKFMIQEASKAQADPSAPRATDCPHAAPFRYCQQCKVTPCPIGLGAKKSEAA